jgi:elongation factor Ts
MAEITAQMVKELRERTGAGMMECKKALAETNGDLEAAIEHMRKSGAAKADKKAGRTAAEGVIAIQGDSKQLAMVEVNCETDFVAKGDEFQAMANAIAKKALAAKPADLDALLTLPLDGGLSVADTVKEKIAKLGENMAVRRFVLFQAKGDSFLEFYKHGTRIGVVVEMEGGNAALAKDIAMHVAASRPVCVSSEQVSQDLIAKEREIYTAQAAESGKPADIVAKMVEGRVQKFLKDVTLLGQPFVKNPDETVEKLLKNAKAKVNGFTRLEVGEGIEKKKVDFAEEVKATAGGK